MLENKVWAIIPAAGVGARMQKDCPKQYIKIGPKTVLEHSLAVFLACDRIEGVQLCISPEDVYWKDIAISHSRLLDTAHGGATRAQTVKRGLDALSEVAEDNDWVLVHDAARPCLNQDQLEFLIDELKTESVGGIFAVPIADTLKRVTSQNLINETVDRSDLWAAQTPQMFRYGILKKCVNACIDQQLDITDEASAIEAFDHKVKIVEGSRANIKLTYPQDVIFVEYFLNTV